MRDEIRTYMTLDPHLVTEGEPLETAAWLMLRNHVRHLPVVGEASTLVGIVEDAFVFGKGRMVGTAWEPYDRRDKLAVVADVMRPSPLTSKPDAELIDVLRRLASSREEAVIVIDAKRRPIGIFTLHDAMRGAQTMIPQGLVASDVAVSSVIGVSREQTVGTALDTMRAHRVRHLVVMRGPRPHAVVSMRNLIEVGAAQRPTLPLRALELGMPETIGPTAPLHRAVDRMVDQKIGCLPIVGRDGTLSGLLTRTDLMRWLIASRQSSDE